MALRKQGKCNKAKGKSKKAKGSYFGTFAFLLFT